MAYVSREKKMKICELLKSAVPKDWKYTVSVHHHSSIRFNLKSSPVDFMGVANKKQSHFTMKDNFELRERSTEWFPDDVRLILDGIFKALNFDNFNDSKAQLAHA